jgi:hypothetical protein
LIEAIRRVKKLNNKMEFEIAITALKLIVKDEDDMEELESISGAHVFYNKAYLRKDMTFEVYETNLTKIKDRIGNVLKSIT